MSLKKKQYEENGSDSEFKYARKNAPEKDDTVSILIDPDDPVTILEPERARRERTASIIGGTVMFVTGLALIVLFAATGKGIFER